MIHTYFDFAATTPVDPEVLNAMIPYFTENFGNTSSTHRFGQRAEAAIETSREVIAELLGCQPKEIFFTSGGSEADNLALRGTCLRRHELTGANRILITPVEHDAVLKTAQQLSQKNDFKLEYIPVDKYGNVYISELQKMLDTDVAIVSVIMGNNEIGTINLIDEIGELCHKKGVPFHTDAVQALGYYPYKLSPYIDLLSAGAHKFYGPKGVGFLYKKDGLEIQPGQTGGGQENGLRAGTHNVAYIVGMAEALRRTRENQLVYQQHYLHLRDQVIQKVLSEVEGVYLTGSASDRLSNHASFVFEHIDGNELVTTLDVMGFCCSSGSACKTGNTEPSGVLLAMGYPSELAKGSLRITVGRTTEESQVNNLVITLKEAVRRLRRHSN